jgi:hypothetical protein
VECAKHAHHFRAYCFMKEHGDSGTRQKWPFQSKYLVLINVLFKLFDRCKCACLPRVLPSFHRYVYALLPLGIIFRSSYNTGSWFVSIALLTELPSFVLLHLTFTFCLSQQWCSTRLTVLSLSLSLLRNSSSMTFPRSLVNSLTNATPRFVLFSIEACPQYGLLLMTRTFSGLTNFRPRNSVPIVNCVFISIFLIAPNSAATT